MKKSISKSEPLLIIGLGNPGPKYEGTPHNAGFLVVDRLLETYNLKPETSKKLGVEIAEFEVANKKIILAKPTTFMNESGSAVKKILTTYNLQLTTSLWLLHDDIDLELGKIKITKNRGSAGHRGVEDVIQKLKTKDFSRFRIGVRAKGLAEKRPKSIMNKFVVSEFGKKDREIFKKSIEKTKEAVIFAIENGIEKAGSVYLPFH